MSETSPTPVVERVARAVALEDCCDPDFIDTKGHVQWTYHVELARAALEASGHAEMVEALKEAELQIAYLHEKFAATGSGETVLFKIRSALARATQTNTGE